VSRVSPASAVPEPAVPVAFVVSVAHTPLPPTPGAEEHSSPSAHIVPVVVAADTASAAAAPESADTPSSGSFPVAGAVAVAGRPVAGTDS